MVAFKHLKKLVYESLVNKLSKRANTNITLSKMLFYLNIMFACSIYVCRVCNVFMYICYYYTFIYARIALTALSAYDRV